MFVWRESRFGGFYGCASWPGCDHMAQVSPHNGRIYITDQATRTARRAAHASFDRLWQSKLFKRGEIYKRLADFMGISRADCHIGHFYADEIAQVHAFVKQIRAEGQQ